MWWVGMNVAIMIVIVVLCPSDLTTSHRWSACPLTPPCVATPLCSDNRRSDSVQASPITPSAESSVPSRPHTKRTAVGVFPPHSPYRTGSVSGPSPSATGKGECGCMLSTKLTHSLTHSLTRSSFSSLSWHVPFLTRCCYAPITL
jgi:hypothetical protein